MTCKENPDICKYGKVDEKLYRRCQSLSRDKNYGETW